MSDEARGPETGKAPARLPRWAGAAIVLLAAGVILLLGLLGFSILERRWEAQRPAIAVTPVAEWEPDSAVWGRNYPREYDTFLETRRTDTMTKFGGSFPRDYLDSDPAQVVLFAGYAFSVDYRQARGHQYSVADVTETKRLKTPYNPGTCMTCKSADVPRLMARMGVKEFYATNFHDLRKEATNPVGCQDCHDPATMGLRITRPALKEALTAQGRDLSQVTHQEMRSLVCAQCHVEYYFKTDAAEGKKDYLTFPWKKGTTVEAMIAYYDEYGFSDFTHAVSKTPMIKAQHPDYELYRTGIHAYRNVSCADCHMPYRSEGGVKFTDHHVQSPLLNIAASCAVCHRWGEAELKDRVEAIQSKVFALKQTAEAVLVKAHFDAAGAIQAGVTEEALRPARQLIRHAQFRWDYVSANNGMGFHSPQESVRILAEAIHEGEEARLMLARLMAEKGVTKPVAYPDLSTRAAAWAAVQAFN